MKSPHILALVLSAASLFGSAALLAFPPAIHPAPTADSGLSIVGVAGDVQLGTAVADAGDMNGDGRPDFVVSSVAPVGVPSRGRTYAVFDAPAVSVNGRIELGLIDGTNGVTFSAPNSYYLGSTVAHADFDGDGFDDLLIGASNYGTSPFETGAVFVIYGRPSGFPAVIDLENLQTADGFRIVGNFSLRARAGGEMASAGDVNDDGFEDIVIGSPSATSLGDPGRGLVHLVYGRATRPTGDIDIAKLAVNDVVRFYGGPLYLNTGMIVGGIGDVNDDGFSDFAFSCPQSETAIGCIVFGSANLPTETSVSAIVPPLGVRIDAGTTNANHPAALASVGDVNGDGISDFAFGTGVEGGTIAYVVFGRGDGFGSLLVLSELDETTAWAIIDTTASAGGAYVLSLAGMRDIDGDDSPDLVIGTSNGDNTLIGEYAYMASTRTARTEFVTALTSLEGARGTWMCATHVSSGVLVTASIGDVNGDGIDDMLVGDRSYGPGMGIGPGAAYIVFGSDRFFNGDFEVPVTRAQICNFPSGNARM